jgi:hypothetical protein
MRSSTWLITRDETRGFKCVQFVLSDWREGANKNQESEVRRQLQSDKGKVLLEDADPFHMYDLVEAEMFLRAGAVFKPRSKLRPKALELVEQMEKLAGQNGGSKEELHESPFADAWQDELGSTGMHKVCLPRGVPLRAADGPKVPVRVPKGQGSNHWLPPMASRSPDDL